MHPRAKTATRTSGKQRNELRTISRQLGGGNAGLTLENKELLDRMSDMLGSQGTRSNKTGRTISRPPSQYSVIPSSHLTNLPDVDRMQVMSYAQIVFDSRKAVITMLTQG
jgi:hypothetical protein